MLLEKRVRKRGQRPWCTKICSAGSHVLCSCVALPFDKILRLSPLRVSLRQEVIHREDIRWLVLSRQFRDNRRLRPGNLAVCACVPIAICRIGAQACSTYPNLKPCALLSQACGIECGVVVVGDNKKAVTVRVRCAENVSMA